MTLSRDQVCVLARVLPAVRIRLVPRRWILRYVPGQGPKRCEAFSNGDGTVELATLGYSAAQLVENLLHEAWHVVGYVEAAVEGRIDKAAYAHPELRAAAALRLLGAYLPATC